MNPAESWCFLASFSGLSSDRYSLTHVAVFDCLEISSGLRTPRAYNEKLTSWKMVLFRHRFGGLLDALQSF